MIWYRGQIMAEEKMRVDPRDRTFEHGLGLFETFRTWNGRASLIGRHRDRIRRSAESLGLDFDPVELPDEEAVRLLRGENSGDLRLRIVMSGGFEGRSTVWMTAGPLPPASKTGGARIDRSRFADPDDPLARHKTLNYWRQRIEQERAAAEGADEVLSVTPDGRICEGLRSNLFLVRKGRLFTPTTDLPILPGVMREAVIDRARSVGIEVVEGTIRIEEIADFDEAFLTNSVRGMLPVSRLLGAEFPAPGVLSGGLWDQVRGWLES